MDVSIKPADKKVHEAIIKAREDEEATRVARKEKSKARRDKRRKSVLAKRLHYRIEKEVIADLLYEKQCYLKAERSSGEYVIDMRVRYGWTFKRKSYLEHQDVKKILEEVLSKHTGFEYKDHYEYHSSDWCDRVTIWYTLVDQPTTPS